MYRFRPLPRPQLARTEVREVDVTPLARAVGEELRRSIDEAFGYGVAVKIAVTRHGSSVVLDVETKGRESVDPLGSGTALLTGMYGDVQVNWQGRVREDAKTASREREQNLQLVQKIGTIVNRVVELYGAEIVMRALA